MVGDAEVVIKSGGDSESVGNMDDGNGILNLNLNLKLVGAVPFQVSRSMHAWMCLVIQFILFYP